MTEEFYRLKDDWERLQEQDPDVTYYSTFEYNKAWWDVYKDDEDKELFIICVYQGNLIVGIAPLLIEKRIKGILRYKLLKFLGIGDYLNILLYRGSKNEYTIIKEIFRQIEKSNEVNEVFDRIQLTHIKHDSILASYLLRNVMYNKYFKYLIECPILKIDKNYNFQDYNRTVVSSRVIGYRNKLKRHFEYKFLIINNKNHEMYNIISSIHNSEKKYLLNEKNRKGRRSLFNDNKRSTFLKNLYNENAKVITFALETNSGEIIVYNTCYFYKNTLHNWNTAYNPKYQKYSPGRVLDYEVINFIFENHFADTFDFGAGRYPYKFEWTKDFIFDYQLDYWNEQTQKGRILKRLYELKILKGKV